MHQATPGALRWMRRIQRQLLTTIAAGALIAAGLAPLPVTANVPVASTAPEALAAVPLPPTDLGQADQQFYIPEAGHTISGIVVDYWRATGAEAVYGNPISEPFAAANGMYSQAFERGVLQFNVERSWGVDPAFQLMPIAEIVLEQQAGTFRADGKRAGGGGNRAVGTWTPGPDGFLIAEEFQAWYTVNEGPFYLGVPLSQPLRERGQLAQWFAGGLLLLVDGEVRLAPLPRERAADLGIDTAPVANAGLPVFDEDAFWNSEAAIAAGATRPTRPGQKRIIVSIAEQRAWVYQGDELVLTTLVSTGLSPNDTSTGAFRIRIKKQLEDMRGATNAEGEVIWVVGDGGDPPPGSIPYGVDDVPNVLYFSLDAEALHGTYWHNNFGNKMSHGCVNLPLPVAEFLFAWAPLGTPIIVTAD